MVRGLGLATGDTPPPQHPPPLPAQFTPTCQGPLCSPAGNEFVARHLNTCPHRASGPCPSCWLRVGSGSVGVPQIPQSGSTLPTAAHLLGYPHLYCVSYTSISSILYCPTLAYPLSYNVNFLSYTDSSNLFRPIK